MQLRRGVGVAIVAAAVTVAAAASVSAAPASSKQVVDRTYSCKVRPARYIDLESSVTLPPENGQPRPGQVRVTTVKKGIQRNGITFYVPQVFFEEKKDSLDVDRSACRRSSRRVPLKTTGLPTPGETATPTHTGSVNGRCSTTKRVLVHLKVTMQNGKPEKALLAVRNDSEKSKPVAFYRWSPSKIVAYLGKTCVETS
jgi:hypothetical protein